MALKENPLATYDELAKKTEYAKSVVFNLIQPLATPKLEQPYFTVTALLHLQNLGLEVFDIIVPVKTFESLEFLKKLCWEHPYTSFYTFCYGQSNGMLIQFRVPKTTGIYIKNLFDELQTQGVIDSFQYFNFLSPQLYTKTDVNYWNIKTYSWDFDWKEWFGGIFEEVQEYSGIHKVGALEFQDINEDPHIPVKNWLNRKDIQILFELFENARRRNIDIMEQLETKHKVKMSPQTFSRRLKRIMDKEEGLVSGHFLALSPKCTNILSRILISGEGDPAILEGLRNHLKAFPIPFSSTFKTKFNHLFWFIELPPNDIGFFLTSMRRVLTTMAVNYIDTSNVKSYHPWAEAYDEKNHRWFQSKKFMLDDVLNKLDEYK